MKGKRDLLAAVCARTGLTRILESMPRRPMLLALNYHRIGDATATPYDSGVFSATVDEFDAQIGYLKRRLPVLTAEEAVYELENGGPSRACALVTFDDGYLDNYTEAFPVLRSHGVQATFFLPTSLSGTNRLLWWDAIAYIVKHRKGGPIRVEYPEPMTFDPDAEGADRAIMRILLAVARPEVQAARFVEHLEEACGCAAPSGDAARCFLNWDEARRMRDGGMAFGSHTHSHEILSKLPPEKQAEELRVSREILERELGSAPEVFAYPVGLPSSFSEETKAALQQTGYRAAFSFYGGMNLPGQIDRYDVRRVPVGPGAAPARFRLQTALAVRTGSVWF